MRVEFVVRVADYYGVSCDYRWAAARKRSHLSVEDIPAPKAQRTAVPRQRAAHFNKKLISNSLNILYDKLNACPDKGLVGESPVI